MPQPKDSLLDARRSLGWSQGRLSRISGVQQSLISALENGRRTNVEDRTWALLSASLGVELKRRCGVPKSWLEFLGTPYAADLEDEVFSAMVKIACSDPGWRRAPVRTWISLVDIVRSVIELP